MVTAFCRQLGWKNMEILISQFQDRLHFGIHSELLELMKLPSLNGVRARTLFDAGFETVSTVASADANVIENILHKAVPFQSEKERDGDDSHDLKKRNKIKTIWITGCCGMTAKEAAENLIVEARKFLENEIGVTEIKWSNKFSVNDEVVNANNSNKVNAIVNDTNNFLNQDDNCEKNNEKTVEKTEPETQSKQSRISLDLLDMSAEENYTTVKSGNRSSIQDQNILVKRGKDSPVCDIFQDSLPLDIIDIKTEPDQNVSTPLMSPIIKNQAVSIASATDSPDTLPVLTTIKTEQTEVNYTYLLPTVVGALSFVGVPLRTENNESKAVKDEIIWDSLNFTEAAISNITKLRTSEKYFSPNISFGDSDDKSTASVKTIDVNEIVNEGTKSASVKDISIFSTDGDNSSIFDESLPLDLIPSRLLDNKNLSELVAKTETTVNFVNINTNSLLDGFASSLVVTDEEEDIKLYFEVDDDDDQPESNFNSSKDNEVMCSQEHVKTINEFTSPYNKRKCKDDTGNGNHEAKKKKINNITADHKTKKSKQPPISKTIIKVNNYRLDCILIKDNDINNNLRVLQGEYLQSASISLKIKPISQFKNIIGSDILNIPKLKTTDNLLIGMGLYIGNDECVFLDENALVNTKNVLKPMFESKLKLNMYCLKTNYLYLKKGLGIELPPESTDLSVPEWLLMSDKAVGDYTELVSVSFVKLYYQ